MRIAVFGATGRTGRHVVSQGLDQGLDVVAFVRSRDKLAGQQDLSHERLHVVEGDVRTYEAVARAVKGAEAVVSCLGPVPKEGMVHTEGTEQIVRAMEAHGVERILSLTGAGVNAPGDPPRSLSGHLIRGIMKVFTSKILADAEGHAEVLRRSGLDYVVVRAPRLTDGPRTGQVRHGILTLGASAQISRADVADFLLSEVREHRYRQVEPHVTASA